jgi:hypothetical protein
VGFLIAFLSMVVVFGLLLPILGMMYLDILGGQARDQTPASGGAKINQ